ncbi:hypothetical protein Y695_00904 [Hydrogenophaga sp. T4]|nr:hypothetical protein Y695_00904 [Hydrogenophaga sp. T4]
MDDAGQGGVARRRSHAEFEFTVFIDRACEDRTAWLFVYRNALARDGGLVDAAVAFGDDAVKRDPLAWFDPCNRVERHIGRLDAAPAPVSLLDFGIIGREVNQALDGVSGAIDRALLDELRDGIEGHHHGGFRPLANDECARDGNRHEGIDIELAVSKCDQAFGIGFQTCQPDGEGSDRHAHRFPGHGFGGEEGDAFCNYGKHQRGSEPCVAGASARCVVVRTMVRGLRAR